MTLYITNSKGGEMTPLDLTPLSRPPRRTKYNRTVRRTYQRQPVPLEDLTIALAGLVAAATALTVPFFS